MTATMEAALPRRPSFEKRDDPSDLRDLRVALYCRVSKEREDEDRAVREKSVDDQEREGRRFIERHQARLVDVYRDTDRSVSQYTKRKRESFDRLCRDVEAGKLDLIWFWEQSRSTRRLDVFATLRNLCRDHGVRWVIRDRVLDPADSGDMLTSGIFAVDENESARTAARVRRGKESAANMGRPHCGPPYGYKREYRDREFVRDVPKFWDGNGTPVENSPAAVVREIFTRIAKGDSLRAIRRDLERRGIPPSRSGRWSEPIIKYIARNPAYIGKRVYRGKILDDVSVMWEPLVDADLFWAVQRTLQASSRSPRRPTRARHLLSGLVRCGVCGDTLGGRPARGRQTSPLYQCRGDACVGIYEPALDGYIEEAVIRYFRRPAVVELLNRNGDSEAARQASAEADQARVELEEWRQLADRGEISPTGYARAEKGLLQRIGEAEQRARSAGRPPVLVLASTVDFQTRAGWDALDLAIKRQIIAGIAEIRVYPVGRGRKTIHPVDRTKIDWLLGPGSEGSDAMPDPE
jgi:site-specific DNA recombinase